METHATILAVVEAPGEVNEVERWLKENAAALSSVTEKGCGCCVMIWEIQGPVEVLKTIPAHLGSIDDLASSAPGS